MRELKPLVPLYSYEDLGDFLEEVDLTQSLVLTIRAVYQSFLAPYKLENVLFVDDFCSGEPVDEEIQQIYQQLEEKTAISTILAIGGGTCLDVAKLISVMTGTVDEVITSETLKKNYQLILVPTTSGTGSEVTNIAAFARKKLGTKIGFSNDALYADAAVLVAPLITKLPQPVFAASAIDALVHGIESALSPNSTHLSSVFSYQAIDMLIAGFTDMSHEGYASVIEAEPLNFLLASSYAGIGFGTGGCAAVHALSYPLGEKFKLPHGEVNARLLIPVLRKYQDLGTSDKFDFFLDRLRELLQTSEPLPALAELLNELLPPRDLTALGFNEELADAFADSVLVNQQRLLINSHFQLSKKDIFAIYQEVMEGEL